MDSGGPRPFSLLALTYTGLTAVPQGDSLHQQCVCIPIDLCKPIDLYPLCLESTLYILLTLSLFSLRHFIMHQNLPPFCKSMKYRVLIVNVAYFHIRLLTEMLPDPNSSQLQTMADVYAMGC